MADLPFILWIGLGLLAWLLLAAGLVLFVVVLPRWHSAKPARTASDGTERRRSGDRRIGLPDPREVRIERRSGIDRRGGPAALA